MLDIALTYAIGCFTLGFAMNLWAFARAATVADRILAVDTMVINGIALIILYGISTGSSHYLEAAILLALTGFVSTISFCKFLLRGSLIE